MEEKRHNQLQIVSEIREMSRILHVQDTTTKRERCEQGVHELYCDHLEPAYTYTRSQQVVIIVAAAIKSSCNVV